MSKPDPRISIAEAADKYGVSQATIRRMIARGQLRAYRIGPRLIRLDARDLDAAWTEVNPAQFAAMYGMGGNA